MLIIIAGSVIISSLVSSALLLSALAAGKRGDHWESDAHTSSPVPVTSPKDPRQSRRLPSAGLR